MLLLKELKYNYELMKYINVILVNEITFLTVN